ncbi:MAG: hypothetical protein JSU95_14215 [Betaproteobacteria bacterium]|nr:MAG: hypothetical protein JSU95_14215 [Betaproteobacteria bacterium]
MKWQPGTSGNPGGRPKGYGDLRELARTHTEEAVNVLVKVMRDEGAAPTARTSAAQALLDRGWGRPEQTVVEQKKEPGLVALLQKMQAQRTEEEKKTEETT